METSINLDLDDLMGPEDGFDDDDDLPAVTRLPGLDDDEDQENLLNTSGQRNEGLLDTLLDPAGAEEGAAPAAKRVVNRKPIPKLDATRLTGERGLPVLMKHFEKVKFKGKGHEVSDLDRLMRVMEHWAHRLFPKMPFDDVIERIEKLGSKKPVQTCIKKIRLDMPLLDEDFVTRGGEDVIEGGGNETTGLGDDFPTPSFPGTQPPSSNTPKVPMTDEQRERIERNKRLAMERRLEKQKEAQSSQKPGASQGDGLDEAELNDLFGTGSAKSKVVDNDGIDSDEDELERELWESQMMEGKKEQKKVPQKGAASEEVEIDADEAEMENEMWNQMTQPVPMQSQINRSCEVPKVAEKSKDITEDESDEEEKAVKDSQSVGSQDEAPKGIKRNKRLIDDDSDDDDVMEVVKDIKTDDSQVMPSKGAKKRRVISDDDDDDEMEDSSKMTQLLSLQLTKDASDEINVDSRSPSKLEKTARVIDEETDDVLSKDVEGIEDDTEKHLKDAEADICNQMTEPVLSQNPTDSNSFPVSQERSKSNSQDEVVGDDAGEVWNQMTEQVETQNINNSQDDQLYTMLKSKKNVINDDDEDDDETQIDIDMCNQDTEPVNTGNSQDTE
ncbi:chromosome segregation in meiosis protein 3-like [Lytechinus variegatus]|uniref:chromosome segregation in meiosis protein 3-like n=1 Tax=Lytechinus variegatus TaxID=7654 RepID=UPI001BB1D274|nr:chromosome segregation in meiosis protein 3-like [Lytechinus variegatus]XP_041464499.1 chromosome segregation in meiosis protein 3-like [Lytechinus variegatus]XP_041464500.1 chromosome segregation in meiosis protein 3-like [Lytechinus variegatus]XP_041464501.1 chromosome segregation in meiosis protein 3-like [Lytechinus variegatus]XP_041464502.1 chromosome segregation in meiosis protein 3-like [Lytechinus variegatus]